MIRKLIRQKDSYTITLPKKWIEHNKLTGAEELELVDNNNQLIIQTQKGKIKKKGNIHLQKAIPKSIRTYVASYYKHGYDLIEITAEEEFDFVKVNQVIEELVGVVILEQREKYLLIECSTGENNDIAALITKLFLTVGYMLKQFKAGDDSKALEPLASSSLRLRYFIQRLINLTQFSSERAIEYNSMVYELERIANILLKASKKNVDPNIDEILELYESVQKIYLKKSLKSVESLCAKLANKRNNNEFENGAYSLLLERLFSIATNLRSILL